MGKTLFGACDPNGFDSVYSFDANMRFHPMAHCNAYKASSETTAKHKAYGAGVIDGFGANIIANTFTAASTTLGVRVAGVTGNSIVTYTHGTTGIITDTTHSDTVNDGDFICGYDNIPSEFLNKVTITAIWAAYDATGATIAQYGWGSAAEAGAAVTQTTSNQTIFLPGGGTSSNTSGFETSETSQSKVLIRAAGTLAHMQFYILTNGDANNATATSRVTGAAGNQTISLTAGVTGFFEDTTHSDAVVSGDTFDYSIATGAGAVNLVTLWARYQFTSTGTGHDIIVGVTSNANGGTTTFYHPVVGFMRAQTTETNTQIATLYGLGSISRMRVYVGANASTNATTMTYRDNGADGNETLSITGSTTGTFEDTTHSDTAVAGRTMGYKYAGMNGLVTPTWAAITLNTASPVVTGDIAEPATAADTVSASLSISAAIAEAASATDTVSAAGTFVESVTEPASATDTAAATTSLSASISEPAPATDDVSSGAAFAVSLSEAASATDTVRAGAVYLLFIQEPANADDGFAASIVPPPVATGARFRPNIVDPRFMEIEHWSALTAAALLPFGWVPVSTTEDEWRQWAQYVRQLPALAPLQIPDPRVGFEDWRLWGFRLNEAILNM